MLHVFHPDDVLRLQCLIAGGNDAGVLDHQDHGALRGAGAMDRSPGDDEALAGLERNGMGIRVLEIILEVEQ